MSLPNIAFIGKAGSGKDTAAELLIEQFGYRRVAFADKLKDVAAELWGEDARKSRCHLQKLGEYVRQIEEDTWVNLALRDLKSDSRDGEYDGIPPVAVTDCRYKNEAWRLKSEGFVIVRIVAERNKRHARLQANGKLGEGDWESHISETDLDDWPEDYKIKNIGTKVDLLAELAAVLKLETGAE